MNAAFFLNAGLFNCGHLAFELGQLGGGSGAPGSTCPGPEAELLRPLPTDSLKAQMEHEAP